MPSVTIVGVLNITPDSYYDGGKFVARDAALRQTERLMAEGADIIEIGGQSTGPGSMDVSVEEELKRVMPVIERIARSLPSARLSIDTWQADVALRAIEAGVTMVNDVTAGRGDVTMFPTLKNHDVPVVLMYAKDATARTVVHDERYASVIETIMQFLRERSQAAVAAGIASERLILDPGLGHFVSSDPKYSFEILARLKEFLDLGHPLLVSPSRKSFLAGREKLSTAERLPGTIAASAIAVLNGASYIRTHDVGEVRRGCEIAEAMKNA
ncbi:MAG: dihydropteroate synthase [Candidatus Peribacteraceae bacterium]|nr:dihydropteroate synthase [Candidatus Peribacteraceae bacterium]